MSDNKGYYTFAKGPWNTRFAYAPSYEIQKSILESYFFNHFKDNLKLDQSATVIYEDVYCKHLPMVSNVQEFADALLASIEIDVKRAGDDYSEASEKLSLCERNLKSAKENSDSAMRKMMDLTLARNVIKAYMQLEGKNDTV